MVRIIDRSIDDYNYKHYMFLKLALSEYQKVILEAVNSWHDELC